MNDRETVESRVQQWLQQCVIGLSLCPFAKVPIMADRVRLSVCTQRREREVLTALAVELVNITRHTSDVLETTLLILPNAMADFLEFNDFLDLAESLLDDLDHQQQYQFATFHPRYQFADVDVDDIGNYTNKSPYPIIQILREASVSKVVDAGETEMIAERNIRCMRALSTEDLARLFPWADGGVGPR